jgi:hypothetical protein
VGSTAIPWDSLKVGLGINYSVAKFPVPIEVTKNYAVCARFSGFLYE